MKNNFLNEQLSESFTTKDSEKIYEFCISLVSSSLKELENEWNQKINNNEFKKNIIESLFSLLYYEILLIRQILKYYNSYINNLDEDNIKLINQIINISKELMNKKINSIINIEISEKCNIINEEKILNYKITQFNENNKKENSSKLIKVNDKNNNLIKQFSYKDASIKAIKTIKTSKNKKNEINNNFYYKNINNKNNIKKEEMKNNSIAYNVNIRDNKFNLKGKISNKNNINNNSPKKKIKTNKDHLKRSNTEKIPMLLIPYTDNTIESSKNGKIKINLADKFLKNNENNDFATLSNLSRQSKKSIHNNLCLTQTTYNNNKKENTYTISVEENPFRKVKNIILNAKNLLLIKTNTPTNISMLNKYRCTTYETNRTNRKYNLSEEINQVNSRKCLNNVIQKYDSKIVSYNKSSKNIYIIKNIGKVEIKKSMSNKDFVSINSNKNKEKQINNKLIKNQKKERECHQILKDGMKKIEKKLNSKERKRELYKAKSNDYFSIIKKMLIK